MVQIMVEKENVSKMAFFFYKVMHKIMYIIADIICFDKNKWRFIKMNKYIKLIESKAIREYLDEIKYIPSAFETAYIVKKNRRLTLNEKEQLWDEIIDIMPDEKIEESFKIGTITLHEYLKKYIEIQRKLYDQFIKKEQNVVYTCSSGVVMDLQNKKPLIISPFYWCNIYTDINMCIQDAQEKKSSLFDVRKHYIKTKSDDVDYRCIWTDLTSDGEILDIGELFVLNDEEEELYQFLKMATVSIPLPFKEGDLIYSKSWDLVDYESMVFKKYKNGYIYVDQYCEYDGKGFSLINELDLEYIDKAQWNKLKEICNSNILMCKK